MFESDEVGGIVNGEKRGEGVLFPYIEFGARCWLSMTRTPVIAGKNYIGEIASFDAFKFPTEWHASTHASNVEFSPIAFPSL